MATKKRVTPLHTYDVSYNTYDVYYIACVTGSKGLKLKSATRRVKAHNQAEAKDKVRQAIGSRIWGVHITRLD